MIEATKPGAVNFIRVINYLQKEQKSVKFAEIKIESNYF